MTLTVHIPPRQGDDPLELKRLEGAAVRGVRNLIVTHLLNRQRTATHSEGMPRSGYWGDAASSVTFSLKEKGGEVSIPKEGVALHFYGGVVLPTGGRKALAFPVHPAVAGMRAGEYDADHSRLNLVPGKDGHAATLREKESGEVYYVLMRKLTLNADRSVLPEESAMLSAAVSAMEAAPC